MAVFQVGGLEDLARTFGNIEQLPTRVIDNMLNAQADVVVRAQKKSAETMLRGKFYTGTLSRAIAKGKVKGSKTGGRQIYVYPRGTRRRGKSGSKTGNAMIAFVNEYGRTGKGVQPARAFIKAANESAEAPAVEAAQKILDEYIKSI